MTQSITSGHLDRNRTILPEDNASWADLGSAPYGSWENWRSWHPDPINIQVSETIDAGSNDYRTPYVTAITTGTCTVEVDISDTGVFGGEETTITFATSTETYPAGRYYRWRFTVEPTSDEVDTLFYALDLNKIEGTVYLSDVDVQTLTLEDSTGFRIIDSPLGYISHVQATALQGDGYVVDDYFTTGYQQANEVYGRDTATVSNTNVGFNTDEKFGTHSFDFAYGGSGGASNRLTWTYPDNTYYASGGEYTCEFWFKFQFDDTDPEATTPQGWIAGLYSNFDGAGEPTDIMWRVGLSRNIVPEPDEIDLDFQILNSFGSVDNYTIQSNITPETWYKITFSYSEPDAQWRLYLNSTSVLDGTLYAFDADSQVYIGKGTDNSGEFLLDEFRYSKRITNPLQWGTNNNIAVQSLQWENDQNTLVLLHADNNTTDDVGVDYGSADYIIEQQGGYVVIENKNPLKLRINDSTGEPWDGAVDLMLRGLPTIQAQNGSITR